MITLQSIKQKHEEISSMIAVFENYAAQKLHYPAISIDLNPGEKCAGIMLGKNGEPDYFLILLPEHKEDIKAVKKRPVCLPGASKLYFMPT